jgi:transposase InsO family protein
VKAKTNGLSKGLADVETICNGFNLHRDAYYKFLKRNGKRILIEKQVVELVKKERDIQPRVGTRKLHKELHKSFIKNGLKVGESRLFDILRTNNMLVKPKKLSCRTTDSYHRFYKYKNLIKDKKVTAPNQVWVSDITYIRTVKGFCYLALITDLYSRKIVGYDISDSLELMGCMRAFKMAVRQARPAPGLIHHSDRGIQYCSNLYVAELNKRHFKISMTEENHCYENAVAERVNGILKDEFYLDQCFFNLLSAKKATKSAIDIYNYKRLHLSLAFQTPNRVFENAVKF